MKGAAKMNGAAKNGAKGRPAIVLTDLSSPEALEIFRKAVKAFTKRRLRTPEMARQTLIAEGILTKSGRRLAKRYR